MPGHRGLPGGAHAFWQIWAVLLGREGLSGGGKYRIAGPYVDVVQEAQHLKIQTFIANSFSL